MKQTGKRALNHIHWRAINRTCHSHLSVWWLPGWRMDNLTVMNRKQTNWSHHLPGFVHLRWIKHRKPLYEKVPQRSISGSSSHGAFVHGSPSRSHAHLRARLIIDGHTSSLSASKDVHDPGPNGQTLFSVYACQWTSKHAILSRKFQLGCITSYQLSICSSLSAGTCNCWLFDCFVALK